MLNSNKDGTVRLSVSPFLKIVLAVIAVALCVIALRGLLAPAQLHAQSSGTMDVNLKTIGGNYIYGSIPVDIEEFPYDALKVEVETD